MGLHWVELKNNHIVTLYSNIYNNTACMIVEWRKVNIRALHSRIFPSCIPSYIFFIFMWFMSISTTQIYTTISIFDGDTSNFQILICIRIPFWMELLTFCLYETWIVANIGEKIIETIFLPEFSRKKWRIRSGIPYKWPIRGRAEFLKGRGII